VKESGDEGSTDEGMRAGEMANDGDAAQEIADEAREIDDEGAENGDEEASDGPEGMAVWDVLSSSWSVEQPR
jgi:hypothetical protein